MIRYIKFKLLEWLIRDICKRSGCSRCFFNENNSRPIYCTRRNLDLFEDAKKAWRIG